MSLKIAGKLVRARRFLPLFILLQTGTFNDNALKQALIGLVVYGGLVIFSGMPQSSAVPFAALIFTLPFLIICAIAGQIADKFDRGKILIAIKRAEVGIMLLAGAGFMLESTFLLCLALGLMGAQSAFFSPTKNAVLPQWLSEPELITGNAILNGFVFVFILMGQIVGLKIVLTSYGPQAVAGILFTLAIIGWRAAEAVPPAPPPVKDLKVDYNPITATFGVLKFAFKDFPVLRPMIGIAWFYGLSTIFVTTFPDYIANTMMYNVDVLTMIMIFSTLGILTGSLLCVILSRKGEGLWISTMGIIGVTLFSLDLYLNGTVSTRAERGDWAAFISDPASVRFMIDVIGASLSAGLFVVPLQAMAQRRANPKQRARLMSAGAVLLNLSVNTFTFMLIGLGYLAVSAKSPFLIITSISAIVSLYSIFRLLTYKRPPSYAGQNGTAKGGEPPPP